MKVTLSGSPQEVLQELTSILDQFKHLPSPANDHRYRTSQGTVFWDKEKSRWKVVFSMKNRTVYIGSSKDYLEALLMQRTVQECLQLQR